MVIVVILGWCTWFTLVVNCTQWVTIFYNHMLQTKHMLVFFLVVFTLFQLKYSVSAFIFSILFTHNTNEFKSNPSKYFKFLPSILFLYCKSLILVSHVTCVPWDNCLSCQFENIRWLLKLHFGTVFSYEVVHISWVVYFILGWLYYTFCMWTICDSWILILFMGLCCPQWVSEVVVNWWWVLVPPVLLLLVMFLFLW